MSSIVVLNRAPGLDDRDVAFWSDAWNQQAREIAALWGVEYTPVVFYSSAEGLPAADCRILTIKPTIDTPGALGFHTEFDGAVFAEVKYSGPDTSSIGSHEVLEELVDPLLNRWARYDNDHEEAIEICDRVEGDSYEWGVTVLGESRNVRLSNYLLPRAFGEADSGPFDTMELVTRANQIRPGGYAILRDITTGKVGNVFARVGSPAAGATVAAKHQNPQSRLSRRLRG